MVQKNSIFQIVDRSWIRQNSRLQNLRFKGICLSLLWSDPIMRFSNLRVEIDEPIKYVKNKKKKKWNPKANCINLFSNPSKFFNGIFQFLGSLNCPSTLFGWLATLPGFSFKTRGHIQVNFSTRLCTALQFELKFNIWTCQQSWIKVTVRTCV